MVASQEARTKLHLRHSVHHKTDETHFPRDTLGVLLRLNAKFQQQYMLTSNLIEIQVLKYILVFVVSI